MVHRPRAPSGQELLETVRGRPQLPVGAGQLHSLAREPVLRVHHSATPYSKVNAVYMPVLELTILLQFLLFHKLAWRRKLLFLASCLLLWGTIVELELCLPHPATENLEWIAIVLWSVETFPQVVLNAQLRSTQGQSTLSVLITICGKTTNFLSTYALEMPLKYVIMAYFSSSMGLTNGWQVRHTVIILLTSAIYTQHSKMHPMHTARYTPRLQLQYNYSVV